MINWINFNNEKINIPNKNKLQIVLKETKKQLKESNQCKDLQYNLDLIQILLEYSKKRLKIPYYDNLDAFKNDIRNLICFSGYYLNLDQSVIDYFENFNFD